MRREAFLERYADRWTSSCGVRFESGDRAAFRACVAVFDRELEGEGALKTILQAMKTARPFVDFINAAVEDEDE